MRKVGVVSFALSSAFIFLLSGCGGSDETEKTVSSDISLPSGVYLAYKSQNAAYIVNSDDLSDVRRADDVTDAAVVESASYSNYKLSGLHKKYLVMIHDGKIYKKDLASGDFKVNLETTPLQLSSIENASRFLGTVPAYGEDRGYVVIQNTNGTKAIVPLDLKNSQLPSGIGWFTYVTEIRDYKSGSVKGFAIEKFDDNGNYNLYVCPVSDTGLDDANCKTIAENIWWASSLGEDFEENKYFFKVENGTATFIVSYDVDDKSSNKVYTFDYDSVDELYYNGGDANFYFIGAIDTDNNTWNGYEKYEVGKVSASGEKKIIYTTTEKVSNLVFSSSGDVAFEYPDESVTVIKADGTEKTLVTGYNVWPQNFVGKNLFIQYNIDDEDGNSVNMVKFVNIDTWESHNFKCRHGMGIVRKTEYVLTDTDLKYLVLVDREEEFDNQTDTMYYVPVASFVNPETLSVDKTIKFPKIDSKIGFFFDLSGLGYKYLGTVNIGGSNDIVYINLESQTQERVTNTSTVNENVL